MFYTTLLLFVLSSSPALSAEDTPITAITHRTMDTRTEKERASNVASCSFLESSNDVAIKEMLGQLERRQRWCKLVVVGGAVGSVSECRLLLAEWELLQEGCSSDAYQVYQEEVDQILLKKLTDSFAAMSPKQRSRAISTLSTEEVN